MTSPEPQVPDAYADLGRSIEAVVDTRSDLYALFGSMIDVQAQVASLAAPILSLGAELDAIFAKAAITAGAVQARFDTLVLPNISISPEVMASIDEGVRLGRLSERMIEAGWLPSRFAPFVLVERLEKEADAVLSAGLAEHFRGRWAEIGRGFRNRLSGYDVDDEAKATFREALKSHRLGHYRSVPRTLFPELERVARVEFQGGALKPPVTSQKGLREGLDDLTLHDVEPMGIAGFEVAKKFLLHLYDEVDEGNVAAVAADPIPNRHASLHGLAIYRTAQTSLNALVLAEFVFRIVTSLKRNRRAARLTP